jgi:hypothetical protein
VRVGVEGSGIALERIGRGRGGGGHAFGILIMFGAHIVETRDERDRTNCPMRTFTAQA